MAENLESIIRRELARYLGRRMPIDSFQDWFAELSWNVEESGETGAIAFAHEVDGVFAEATSADWTEGELREELENIIHAVELRLESSNVVLAFTPARKSIGFEALPRAYSRQETQTRHCA